MIFSQNFWLGLVGGVGLLALGAPLRAETIPVSPTLQKVIDGAKQEGKLSLSYAANILGGVEGARIGAAGIKQMFGVDLDVTYYPGPSFAPMVARLMTEMQAGQPSSTDLYNGTAVELTAYLARGLFREIPWTTLYPGRLTPEIVEGDSRAIRIVTKIPGVMFNKRVAPEFAAATEMNDLLKPQYKGKVYTTPYLAGFDVLLAKDVWGYEKTEAFLKQLAPNIGGLVACAGTDRIASGEIPALALSCAGAETHVARYRDALDEAVLRDAGERRYDYLAVPVNAAHPNAATLFALYASSPEGQQKILRDLFGAELDAYPDTATHEQIAGLRKEGMAFTDVTIAWWGSHPGIDSELGKLIKLVLKQ